MSRTTEELANDYVGMQHSVTLINDVIAGNDMAGESAYERQRCVDRNVAHLEIMVAKTDWGSEDMTASNDAITAGKAYTAS